MAGMVVVKRIFLLIAFAATVYGTLMVKYSVKWGYTSANAFLRELGGTLDSNQFAIILQESIRTTRVTGLLFIVVATALIAISNLITRSTPRPK